MEKPFPNETSKYDEKYPFFHPSTFLLFSLIIWNKETEFSPSAKNTKQRPDKLSQTQIGYEPNS